MYCPDCKIELNCGCKSCMKHSPNKPNKMVLLDNEMEACPNCNLTMHIEAWFDVEGRQYDQQKEELALAASSIIKKHE